MRSISFGFLAFVSMASVLSWDSAKADDWRWHNDIRHFHEYDYDHWRSGYWYHGWHEGRDAWWWIVGGGWYFYPEPIYPFPNPYVPSTVVVESSPAPTVLSVQPTFYYFCRRPEGYYPYVAWCTEPWQRLPTQVTMPPPVVAAPPPVVSEVPQPQPFVSTPPSPGVDQPPSQRELDDRQLNSLAVEFQDVDLKDPAASFELKSLGNRVSAFRQGLYQRSYNAMDIMHDAENLEHRIGDARTKLVRHKEKVSTPKSPEASPIIESPKEGGTNQTLGTTVLPDEPQIKANVAPSPSSLPVSPVVTSPVAPSTSSPSAVPSALPEPLPLPGRELP